MARDITSSHHAAAGDSCLHEAASGGHHLVTELLHTHGRADTEGVNDGGATPYILAVQKGHLQAVVSLVERCGADKYFVVKHGGTTGEVMLLLVCWCGCGGVVWCGGGYEELLLLWCGS